MSWRSRSGRAWGAFVAAGRRAQPTLPSGSGPFEWKPTAIVALFLVLTVGVLLGLALVIGGQISSTIRAEALRGAEQSAQVFFSIGLEPDDYEGGRLRPQSYGKLDENVRQSEAVVGARLWDARSRLLHESGAPRPGAPAQPTAALRSAFGDGVGSELAPVPGAATDKQVRTYLPLPTATGGPARQVLELDMAGERVASEISNRRRRLYLVLFGAGLLLFLALVPTVVRGSRALAERNRASHQGLQRELSGARREKEHLESQLDQARRLESLGQLAGGIAHDFNNLLSVILNYATFVKDELEDPRLREDVGEIYRAAERAAELTRQLLVFSRHEAVATRVVDLRRGIAETERLLRRTIGENIELRTSVPDAAASVELGVGQLEQILINLAVNARDAMPSGGTLTIELGVLELGEADAASFVDLDPGRYAQLTVSDTGSGMSEEVAARAFDPFFTTKARGHGTGLGLATVYGIARKAGGGVHLYSEPGRGTAVKVYVPVSSQASAATAASPAAPDRARGETVLLVEDEDGVRSVARRILTEQGYGVVSASGPGEALALCHEHTTRIDLLVTDVVMPEMPGSELAERIRSKRGGLPVLFISGYTGDVVLREGVAGRDARLLEKPFTARALLCAVREALEAGRPVSDGGAGSDA